MDRYLKFTCSALNAHAIAMILLSARIARKLNMLIQSQHNVCSKELSDDYKTKQDTKEKDKTKQTNKNRKKLRCYRHNVGSKVFSCDYKTKRKNKNETNNQTKQD